MHKITSRHDWQADEKDRSRGDRESYVVSRTRTLVALTLTILGARVP